MNCTIRTLPETKLIGQRLTMSAAQNTTFKLWNSFMPHRKEITNACGTDLFSVQVYPADYNFETFDPLAGFEKWAAIEVADFTTIPPGMEPYTLIAGLYAVFNYTGAASEGEKAFRYIFGNWLPASGYALDNRPHFEILGPKYKHNQPDSEEEIWIPIKNKG
jgi:AraC family transcriptional regulator